VQAVTQKRNLFRLSDVFEHKDELHRWSIDKLSPEEEKNNLFIIDKRANGPVFQLSGAYLQSDEFDKIKVSAKLLTPVAYGDNQLVVHFVDKNQENVKWRYIPLNNKNIDINKWSTIEYYCSIPHETSIGSLKVYIWFKDTSEEYDIKLKELDIKLIR
jgi:hypothetical protein